MPSTESLNQNAEFACRNIVAMLAHYADFGTAEQIVTLFTDDAVVELPGRRAEGKQALLDMVKARPATRVTRHFVSQSAVFVDGSNAARAVTPVYTYEGTRAETNDEPLPLHPPRAIGDWLHEFRLTESGWKISNWRGRMAFVAAQ
jgi:hypothetical protein